MKKNYLFKFGIALLVLFSTVGYSQYFEPVPVAGFNVDGVAETAPAAGSTNSGLDGSNNCVYTKSYAIGGGMSGGLPDNGIVNRCFDSYQFAPYNQNNVLYLGGNQSGTLTFNTPKAYTTLNVVGFGSNGTKGFTSVVNFTDGTSQTVTGFNFPDWDYYVAPDFILSGFGRSLRSPDYVSYTTAVNMHKVTLNISAANQTKLVASITFTADSNFPNHISIMAVSGIPYVQVPVTGQCGAVVNYTLPTTSSTAILPKVLLLAHDTNVNINDVKAKLVATNQFGAVDTYNLNTQGIPTLAQLNGYNSILFWGNNFYSGSASIGTVIKSYIDNGGGVVEGSTSDALAVNLPAGYNFFSSAPSGYAYPTSSLGAITLPSHPIMNNVTSFTNTGSVHSNYTLVPAAYLIASYVDSRRLAVAMENVGPAKAKRALLCFSPPSKDVLNYSWNSSTDGAKIMANALKWVANPYTQTAGLPSGSVFPVGTTTNTYTYYDSSNVQQTCSFDVVVKDTQIPVAISKNITVTLSPAGTVTITPADVNNGSTDNCGTPTLSLNKTSFDQTNIGSNLVTLTATDASGNTATTTAIVTVLPSDYDDITVNNTTGQCGTVVNYATPTFNVVKPKLLLAVDDITTSGKADDVKAKLTATGQFQVVDILYLSTTVPTVDQLRQYDAILMWTNGIHNDAATIGNRLADYIDLGGGLVDAVFDNAFDNILGNYNSSTYRVLMPAPQASGSVRTLGSIALPAHPIMTGITSFNGGTSSYVSTSTSIAPTSYIIANYDNNLPLIIAKENAGLSAAKRVSLNIYPPSEASVPGGWSQATQGTEIMVNALKWAAKRIPVQTAGLPAKSVFPVGTTTNTFEYTDSNNVVHTFSFDVIVNDTENPVITCIADAITTSCDGIFTFATPVFSDNCPSSVLTQTAGLPSGSVFPVGQTLNTFLVTDASGNTATCSFTVTRNADLSATTSQVDVLCNGSSTGSASVVASGSTGIGTYTYLWSNGATSDAITNVTAGNYSVTIKDGNGCELIKNFTITQPSAINLTASQVDVLCYGNATGSATIAVNGGTAPYSYLWSTGATTTTISNLTAGAYSVTVTDANGCTKTQLYTITEPTAPLATTPNTSQINIACNGGNSGSATIAVNGGTAPYSYLWNTGATTDVITNLAEGSYSVTVTDANGCTLSNSYTITEPAAPLATTPNTSQVDVLCYGNATGSATIAVNGGTAPYSYLWNTGAATATITNLIAGTYSVTVTDANGCTLSNNYTITEPAAPLALTPNTTQVDVFCYGNATGSATIAVDGGTAPYSYLWNTGATTTTISNLIAGTYSVTVTDANGCTLLNNYTITEPAAPLALTPNTSQINVACNGGNSGSATIAVDGGTAPYSYLWNNGETTDVITNLIAGTYSVTVTDANGCTLTNSYTITEPAAPLATTPNTSQINVACNGGNSGSATIAVNGGTAPYSYLWDNGETTNTITGLTAGTYTVDVTDANGCTLSQSFTITEPTVLAASAGTVNNVSCFGAANGLAAVNVTGGTGAYSYSWNTTPVQTTATAVNLGPGTYVVTVKDANLCETTQSFTINQPDALTATIDSYVNVLCYNAANGTATVTATGGTPDYTYSWNTNPVQTTATAVNLAPGNYTVTVTDANGCIKTAAVNITQPAAPLHLTTSQTNVTCYGGFDGSLGVDVTGGTGPYTYTWTPAVSTTNTATGLGVGNYKIVVTDANGCTDLRYLSVTSPLLLTGTIAVTNVGCGGAQNGSAVANITGGTAPYQYLWSNGATTASIDNLAGGTYTISVTDAHNCTFTASTTITEPATVAITSQPQDASVEAGQWVVFSVTAQNATQYQWQVSTNGGTTWANVPNGGASPHYSGGTTAQFSIANITMALNGNLYRVIVSQNGGCTVVSDEASLTVTAPVAAIEDVRKLSMTVYPNPASTNVYIKIPDFDYFENLKVAVYDLNGRMVRNEQPITSDNYQIDVTSLESAVYIITITSDTGRIDKKIVVNKTL